MKELLEAEFQKLLIGAYGSAMISKEQQTDIKLAFFGGMLIAHKTLLDISAYPDALNGVKQFSNSVTEIFHETNNER